MSWLPARRADGGGSPPDRAVGVDRIGAPAGGIPDRIGVITAWRTWVLHPDGTLHSPSRGTSWPPGLPLDATCTSDLAGHSPRIAPAEACGCGIYGVRSAERAVHFALRQAVARPEELVLGRTRLWGRIQEHVTGWRASRAYPEALYVHPSIPATTRAELAARYGVPVDVHPPLIPAAERAAAAARTWTRVVGALAAAALLVPAVLLGTFALVPLVVFASLPAVAVEEWSRRFPDGTARRTTLGRIDVYAAALLASFALIVVVDVTGFLIGTWTPAAPLPGPPGPLLIP